jgi:hypothetical protein
VSGECALALAGVGFSTAGVGATVALAPETFGASLVNAGIAVGGFEVSLLGALYACGAM